jgi:hypothetical protein
MSDRYEYSEKYKTPVFRGAFVRVFDGEDIKDQNGQPTGKTQWGLTAIFEKGEDTGPLKAAMVDAAKKCWGSKAAEKIKHPKFRNPLKDGGDQVDKDGNLYAGFEAGQTVCKIATKNQAPGIVDRQVRRIADAEGKTLVDKANGLYEVIEDNAVFSGCHFKATYSAMAYDRPDGFGVSFKLENLQLVKQGERLGGGGASKAEDDFADDVVQDDGTSGDDLTNLLGAG